MLPQKVTNKEARRAFWTMLANLPESARSELRLFYVTGTKGKEKEPLLRITTPMVLQKDVQEDGVLLKSDLTGDALELLKAIKKADIMEGEAKGSMWTAIEQVVANPEGEHSLSVWARVIEVLRARMSSPPKSVPAHNTASWQRFAFSLDRLLAASPELESEYDKSWMALRENLRKARTSGRYITMEDFHKSGVDKEAWELVWGGKVVPSPSVSLLEKGNPTGNPVQATPKNVQIALKWPVPPHCVVLEGVPGTGKTYRLKKVRDAAADAGSRILGDGSGRFAVTLHPATAYEDFVEGLRPAKRDANESSKDGAPSEGDANKSSKAGAQGCQVGEFRKRDDKSEEKKFVLDDRTFFFSKPATPETSRGAFTLQDGFFVSICIEAGLNPTKEFVVLLDELNRCNIPKVMGDLLTTLESSKRATWRSKEKREGRCWDASVDDGFWDITDAQVVTLPYSRRLFFVPDNVYVIATMNTTDRSVAPMDAALRRRFAFERVWPIGFEPPNKGSTKKVFEDVVKELRGKRDEAEWKLLGAMLGPTIDAWIALNTSLQKFGDDAMLGHSYLFDLVRDLGVSDDSAAQARIIEHHWNKHIFPQLVDSLLSNDLIDRVFPQEGTATRDSGDSLPKLGLELTGDWKLLWSLRGTGLMRVPTITVSVKDEASAEQDETKTGNEAET